MVPGLVVLTMCHGLFGFGYVITATFLVAMVRASASARVLEPLVWLLVGLAAFPSTALWDRVAARIGPRRAYGAACATQAVGVAVGGLWPSAPGALLAALLLGATIMGLTALGFAVARELGQRGAGAAVRRDHRGVWGGTGDRAGDRRVGARLDGRLWRLLRRWRRSRCWLRRR